MKMICKSRSLSKAENVALGCCGAPKIDQLKKEVRAEN